MFDVQSVNCSNYVSYKVSGSITQIVDTRNLIRLRRKTVKLRHCCPAGATFPERSLGKSLDSIPYKLLTNNQFRET
jgi:hypothetical protein